MTSIRPFPRIGTAGWSVPLALAHEFPGSDSHLERYARVLDCVEINSSFYRPHRRSTYERWAKATPEHFRFSVKMPREITHDRRLSEVEGALEDFLEQIAGLGQKLGAILVQFPPSFAFEPERVGRFFEFLRSRSAAPIACEPREQHWFLPEANQLLTQFQVMRVAADPAVIASAAEPDGWTGRPETSAGSYCYFRWHGSPKVYWSPYEDGWLDSKARRIASSSCGCECWCIFDNTAAGAATSNALSFARMVHPARTRSQEA